MTDRKRICSVVEHKAS